MNNVLAKLNVLDRIQICQLLEYQQSIIDDKKQYTLVNEINFCDGLNDVVLEWFSSLDIDVRGHIKDYIVENLKF